MKYNPEKHHRRSIRLKDYDYSQCGAYFVTICTQERLCFFGDAIDSVVVLNATGKMIEKTFAQLPEKYPGIQIDAFVVMPNHIHGIILIGTDSSVGAVPRGRPLSTSNENDNRLAGKIEIRDEGQPQIDEGQPQIDEGQPQGVAPTDEGRLSLSEIVHRFKSFTTNLYSRGVKDQGWTPFPGRLWQRNYYERVIRENGEMTAIRKYIENNPYTWDEDSENPNYVGSGQQIQAPNTAGLHRRR